MAAANQVFASHDPVNGDHRIVSADILLDIPRLVLLRLLMLLSRADASAPAKARLSGTVPISSPRRAGPEP